MYIHLRTSMYIYVHLRTSTYIYVHLRTFTYIYVHSCTSTYIVDVPSMTKYGGANYHIAPHAVSALSKPLYSILICHRTIFVQGCIFEGGGGAAYGRFPSCRRPPTYNIFVIPRKFPIQIRSKAHFCLGRGCLSSTSPFSDTVLNYTIIVV